MSDYTKTTNFTAKDSLSTGDPNKLIKGSLFDTEFDAIVTAIATKYDVNDIASTAQAEAETSNAVLMTPSRVATWSDANAGIVGDLQALTDPGADTLLGWDDSATAAINFTIGTGLTTSGTTIATDDAAIVHDSLSGFVANEHIDHSGVSITAGTGLSGGGTIAATRTLNLDISGLTAETINDLIATDGILVDNGGVMLRMALQDMGTRVVASATQTLALDDANALHRNTTASNHTITIPPNSTVAFNIGAEMAFVAESTGNITLAAGAGVTINSLSSNLTVSPSGGGAYLVKVDTDTWDLVGDLE